MLGRALFLATIPAALIVACSDSDDNTSDGGAAQHSTACSNGTPYAADATPKAPPATLTRNPTAPQCVAHCGEDSVVIEGSTFTTAPIDALPSGTCVAGDNCTMTAGNYQVCGANKIACNQSTFYCDCESGNWACYTVLQGANSCTTCSADGGT